MRGPRRVQRIGVLSLAWVWGTGAVLASQPTVQDAQEREAPGGCEATIVAHVNNYAAIQPDDLAAAEREAARIYEAIRVRIRWVPNTEPRPPDPCGLPLRVLLLSRDMELELSRNQALGDTVFGFITREIGLAHILTHRIITLARRYSDDFRRLLGQAIAHEMGHLLLPTGSHADRGIMQARLGVRAYGALVLHARTSRRHPRDGSQPRPLGLETSPVPRSGSMCNRERQKHNLLAWNKVAKTILIQLCSDKPQTRRGTIGIASDESPQKRTMGDDTR